MLRDTLTVYLKEMREVLRDRKTLVFMIALPMLLVPLILKLTFSFMEDAERKANTESLEFVVFGAEHAPSLEEALREEPGFVRVDLSSSADIGPAIADGRIDFGLVVHPSAQGRIVVEQHYDNAPIFSGVRKRVKPLVERVSEQQRDAKLAQMGLDEGQRKAVIEPVVLEERGVASPREVLGERMGGMLPYMFIIFCFLGSLYPAIDLAAGEKERGTLETLLLAPVGRFQLVLGKFAVVFTTGVVATVLGTGSLGFWLLSESDGADEAISQVISAVGVGDLALMAALLIPIAAIFASMLLSISIYAKSFKEAQSYMGPLNMVVILPAFLSMVPGVELNWRWAMIPISNVSLAIKEIVKGTLDPAMLGLIFASTTVLALAMLALCARMFSRESVIFRQ